MRLVRIESEDDNHEFHTMKNISFDETPVLYRQIS